MVICTDCGQNNPIVGGTSNYKPDPDHPKDDREIPMYNDFGSTTFAFILKLELVMLPCNTASSHNLNTKNVLRDKLKFR
jgi:hypothetical protein